MFVLSVSSIRWLTSAHQKDLSTAILVTWRLSCSESHCEIQRTRPWVGQTKCSACRQRLYKTCPWNLGFFTVHFSNYLILSFCLKRVIQIYFYRIHFSFKTYKVLPTRGVWMKGHPVKEIIIPLKYFFKFFIVVKAHWALVSL